MVCERRISIIDSCKTHEVKLQYNYCEAFFMKNGVGDAVFL
jgi:hypothetical protein